MTLDFNSLNPKQKEAVLYDKGHLLVLAGAGSGKTRVLTYRMAYLINQKQISPYQIFAVTFTNKAAGEMRERMRGLHLNAGPQIDQMWLGTFHSLCLRILRRHGKAIGFEPNFSIYDQSDQASVVKEILAEFNLNIKNFTPKGLVKKISHRKTQGQLPSDIQVGEFDIGTKKFVQIYEAYQDKLFKNQAMDFGDIILNTIKLFREHPEVLEHYQNQFQHLLVDEYQDTNLLQYQLIFALSQKGAQVFCVGDDDQSIYKFRGAQIDNILNMKKDFSGLYTIRLEQNYRSTPQILEASGSLIAKNKGRMGKTLWTEAKAGSPVLVYQGYNEKDEAQFVASQILALKSEFSLNEMAIFYRTHAQSRVFEDQLRRLAIPYTIFGGLRFYDRKEIKDILAYLSVITNPSDTVSLKRIINTPLRGIGTTSISRLMELGNERNKTAWQILEMMNDGEKFGWTAGPYKKLVTFFKMMEELRKLSEEEIYLVDFIQIIYEKTGLAKAYEEDSSIEAQSRLENLNEFLNSVRDYVRSTDTPSLSDFVQQAALLSDQDNAKINQPKLTLMTLHLAKGLEFDAVFLVGLEQGLLPHSRSLDKPEDIEEERRLCYVGMTRAKQKLFLSHAEMRSLYGQVAQHQITSCFLKELDETKIKKQRSKIFENFQNKSSFSFGSNRFNQKAPSTFDFDQRESFSPSPSIQRTKNSNQSQTTDLEPVYDYSFSQENQNPYRVGVKIEHPRFGIGQIRACQALGEGSKITVRFGDGRERLIHTKYIDLRVLG